jgi:5-methylcytosine-specific restriction endonuclease McrA
MWLSDPAEFAARHRIPETLAVRLRCTGEHLVAWQDGGGSSQSNIVAACSFCNRTRHRRSSAPSPDAYRQDVQRRLRRGKWHPLEIQRLVALVPPK